MSGRLIIDALSKQYRRHGVSRTVVNAFSATIEQGEVVAIVGESGSGKSTIARMIVGLESPSAGARYLELDGKRRDPSLKDVQMVFQDPFASLNPVHRVRTHLERSIKRLRREIQGKKAIEAELHRLLQIVELSPTHEYMDRFPDAMSGGQRQRVAIARALAPAPKFLIADEPTSMLDVSIRREVLNLLRGLRDDGMGIVLITHDLKSVQTAADRVFVLKDGICVESGQVRAVLNHPQHPYTKLLMSAVPDPDGDFLVRHDIRAADTDQTRYLSKPSMERHEQ